MLDSRNSQPYGAQIDRFSDLDFAPVRAKPFSASKNTDAQQFSSSFAKLKVVKMVFIDTINVHSDGAGVDVPVLMYHHHRREHGIQRAAFGNQRSTLGKMIRFIVF